MKQYGRFYIDGSWADPIDAQGSIEVIDPSAEEAFATIALGGRGDVDRAVTAASRAFESFYQTSPAERLELLKINSLSVSNALRRSRLGNFPRNGRSEEDGA